MKKFFSLILVLILVFGLAACGSSESNTTTTDNATETESVSDMSEEQTTEIQTESVTDKEEETDASSDVTEESKDESETEDSTSETEEENKKPSTKAEILAEYTKVMNQAKKDAPGFTKIEYQELPEKGRVVSEGSGLVNTALKVAANFMTSKEKAEKEPEVMPKGNDMDTFPLRNCPSGCLLTDPDFLKTAKYEELPNGNCKITIVLESEVNPEPVISGTNKAQSKTGSVLSPASKQEIDDSLNGSIVSAVAKDITYQLKYHDCKVELIYNPKNNHIVSFYQLTQVSVKGSARVLGMTLAVENTELLDYMTIKNFVY